MRKFVLLAILAGISWWYFIGSRKISEEHVTRYYRDFEHAMLSRSPELLCSMLAEEFETVGTVSGGGRRVKSTHNKAQACEAYTDMYAQFDLMGKSMGGMVQLDSRYQINSIQIQPDGKSAIVDYSSSLDVAGRLMNIRSRSTDTLIRRNGKVLMLHSDAKGVVNTAGGF